jgi:hypothetical protein
MLNFSMLIGPFKQAAVLVNLKIKKNQTIFYRIINYIIFKKFLL